MEIVLLRSAGMADRPLVTIRTSLDTELLIEKKKLIKSGKNLLRVVRQNLKYMPTLNLFR
jgi:hypothetical protein